ncbi:hypothetical protein OEW28_07560 [Defluviimonas sp. WL0002]|uniref:Sulfotransferase family protein n=1 Tax=Albidovulum marisflavi TaxID=2984159 RepID=A0ABT2ZBH7_9RHOB|nr:sulfotransferase family protein [Defluviimonas sp. WL0002]MCV2868482.1 hypothetical protein [Defluviimonas sp. WL0002]
MTLRVIGSGFGRTGTMSVKRALEMLGIGKCHHMGEIYGNFWQVPYWQAASRGESVDWEFLLSGYGASIDWPSAHFWRELSVAFPDARIIHTTRSAESWWQSYSDTIMKFIDAGMELPDGPIRDMCDWCVQTIGEKTFGSDFRDQEAGLKAFDRRLAEVREAIPEDRLLVFDVAEGWAPLCDFLGVPVPKVPFPRTNDRRDFWQNFATAV